MIIVCLSVLLLICDDDGLSLYLSLGFFFVVLGGREGTGYAMHASAGRLFSLGARSHRSIDTPSRQRLHDPGCNCGNGTHIFIFDTGVRLTHTEFAGRGGLAISFLLDAQNVTDGKCIVRPLDFVEVKTMMMIIMGSPHSLAHSHFRMP